MLSCPVYAYGNNRLPAERVAEEVRETGATLTLDELISIPHRHATHSRKSASYKNPSAN